MTIRKQIIDAGAKAHADYFSDDMPWTDLHRQAAAAVIDAVEPIIQGEMVRVTRECVREEILLDLWAKVEGLRSRIESGESGDEQEWVRLGDVLSLLNDKGAQP